MPSPFPGMDPFLEGPGTFPDLHDRLISGISDAINAELNPPYYSAIASRILVELSERMIGPDVGVVFAGEESPPMLDGTDGGGIAVISSVEIQPVVIHVPHDEIREVSLEIRTSDDERLVTSIEVLSHSNKSSGEHGRELYKKKQREILDSRVNLVEIDLLRGGEHTTAVPLHLAQRKTGRFDYHICIHRFEILEDFIVYPIKLRSRLPKIDIPLLPGDADVTIDLQAIFEKCYETGLYSRRVKYGGTLPLPQLTEIDQRWARELLSRTS